MTPIAPPYDVVVFDLDGTIIDSEPGVYDAIRHALLVAYGITPTTTELEAFMGPPLNEVLPATYGISDPAEIQRFFDAYCDVYFHGTEYVFDVYAGMAELIRDLDAAEIVVTLGTAKPQESAERILEHAALRSMFTYVAGSSSDGTRQDKAEVLEHLFQNIEADGTTHRIVMVGDRALDVNAATHHGLESIAVEWGYAPDGELDETSPTHRVGSVTDLRALLLD